ncbi:MAG: dienelactone hydrolase family protein [Candidatus Binatia bacterium]
MANGDDESVGSTRREFLMTTLAVGFAAAVRPTDAEAVITTGTAGIVENEVKIPVPGGSAPGYRAQPARAAKMPLVLVVEEIFGVHEHIKDLCRRLAKQGYFAVAPELFARQGNPARIDDPKRIMSEIVAKTPDAQVMADLDATVAWAVSSGCDPNTVAITGFCWGGRITWLYAAHSPKVKAGVAWYGRLDGTRSELQPQYPLDVAAGLKAPVLGLYGGKDDGIPLEQVEKMQASLKSASSKSDVVVYRDAGHGFNADYRPSYREADAQDGWKRMLAWFAANGVK